MSLREKIEAVIYAAEEPVTLAQLAGVFAQELTPTEPRSEDHPSVESLIEQGFIEADHFLAGGSDLVDTALLAELEERKQRESVADPAAAAAEAKRAARQRERDVHQQLKAIVDELITEYAHAARGMEIREVAGGYRIATKPEYHDAVRAFVKSLKPPMKLSLQALETLAVIAYKQPVTAPEVSEIRGVDSSGVLGSLISRKLITTAGRKHVIGRPILYKTTKEFLLRFGLKDLNELPSIEEFEKMAGELAETEDISAPTGQMPFADAEADDEDGTSTETDSDPEEAETKAAAAAAVRVSDESASREFADFPGVAVEAEVKPTEMVDAGEATSSVGQPGEGD